MNTPASPHASERPIAVTLGDASGIGPEIVLKACQQLGPKANLLIIGDRDWITREATRLGLPIPAAIEHVGALPADLRIGEVDPRAGEAAYAAIVRGAELALEGRVRALVTAPINKEAMQTAGHDFPGHTELLAALAGGVDVRMMLESDQLRVVLNSIHLPLADAIRCVQVEQILQTVEITNDALKASGIMRPRIAVAGLNPHAGEGGLFGREEIEAIGPAVETARLRGIEASGPFAPDTVFMRARGLRDFDVVVAMYHDQGLIPIKYLGLDEGVNITIGLPFVRTSPDHGTAFDLAGRCDASGRGLAQPASLLGAIRCADRMSSR
jgi:4-hydroxythreonine-4-phosphate dehydrogenase